MIDADDDNNEDTMFELLTFFMYVAQSEFVQLMIDDT